ncbi:YqzG/YhdC family protein [Brevibacillus sp. SAFN-007a]|uniref:YqzG/YhdC family protein n=1 Tax=Brevibacillus sp. SAFN-007a TaxID=3436862 RepID=UPI003F7F8D87
MQASVAIHLARSVLTTVAAILLVFFFPIDPACAQPPYAKWGRLAMQETLKKYPHAEIVDYQHVGRTAKTPTTSEETFKLLLQEGNRRWALLVHIEFENQTEHVVQITYEEST